MIKINLLGDDTKLDYSNRYVVIALILSVVLVSVISFRLYQSTSTEVRQLSLEASNLQSKLQGLEKQTAIVKELETKKDVLKDKLVILAKLRKNRIGPVKVLDDLNLAIPETIWLRQINESNSSFKILGRAIDNQDIALFITQLQESEYFETVDLVESRQMYYSKRTGQVSGTPDISSRSGLGAEGRVTKTQKFSVRGEDKQSRSRRILDNNVKIKEFIIRAKVNYGGRIGEKEVQSLKEVSELPELEELKDL